MPYCHPAILPSRVHRRPAAACTEYYKQSAEVDNTVLAVTCRRLKIGPADPVYMPRPVPCMSLTLGGMLGRQVPPPPIPDLWLRCTERFPSW